MVHVFFYFSMSRTTIRISLDLFERALLQKIFRKHSVPEFLKQRLQIVLAAATGLNNQTIAEQYHLERHRVSKWRKRWGTAHRQWQLSDKTLRPALTETLVFQWLGDQKGRGRKADFTPEQRTKIAGLCLQSPEENGFPVTHWTTDFLTAAAINHGIVDTISRSTVHRILKKTTCRPIRVGTGSTPR
jgi:hypothetical protein